MESYVNPKVEVAPTFKTLDYRVMTIDLGRWDDNRNSQSYEASTGHPTLTKAEPLL